MFSLNISATGVAEHFMKPVLLDIDLNSSAVIEDL